MTKEKLKCQSLPTFLLDVYHSTGKYRESLAASESPLS